MRRESLSLLSAAVIAAAVALAGCSGGSTSARTPTAGAGSGLASGSGSGASGTAEAQAVAYSQCIRSHGVPNFPDPVPTPSGGYGYRTSGIDPNSTAFQSALTACKGLPSPWNSTGEQLTATQQQAWLTWAQCIRTHGVPDFPDPTFSGSAVHDSGLGSTTPQLQQAMGACTAQKPSVGGLGG